MRKTKRFGWFVYDALECIGELMLAIGFLTFLAGLCLIGPPFPPDQSTRLALFGIASFVMVTACLIAWAGCKISDRDGPLFWLRLRLMNDNISIRAICKASRALRRSGIRWGAQYTAEVLVGFVNGTRTNPSTNGEKIAWLTYKKYR